MRRSSKRGFLLAYAIMILGLVGMAAFLLSRSAVLLGQQTDRMRSQVHERALAASGAAWVAANGAPAEDVTLDVSTLSIPESELEVSPVPSSVSQAMVRTSHFSRRRRQIVRADFIVSCGTRSDER